MFNVVPLLYLLNDTAPKTQDVTGLVVNAVIAVTGFIILYLTGRFIAGYDDKFKVLHARIDKQAIELKEQQDCIDKLEKKFAQMELHHQKHNNLLDEKIHKITIKNIQELNLMKTQLEVIKERLLRS